MNICWLATSASAKSEVFIQREIEAIIALGHRGLVCGVSDGAISLAGDAGESPTADDRGHNKLTNKAWRRGFMALARCGLWQIRRFGDLARLFRTVQRAYPRTLTHVHAHFAHLPAVYGCGLAAMLALPFSVSVHARDAWVPWPAGLAALAQARRIICCNEAVKARLLTLRPALAARTALVHHGLLRREIPLTYPGIEERQPLLFAAGRWVAKKGFAVLMHAFAMIRQRLPYIRLCLAGDGPEADNIKRLAAAIAATDPGAIAMPGWLTPEEIRHWLCQCTAAVIPSVIAADGDRDGIPNIALEAMAAGAPLVASKVGGIPEVVANGITGRLVEAGDATALADAICDTLAQPAIAREWAIAGRVRIERDFIAEDNAAKWVAAISG